MRIGCKDAGGGTRSELYLLISSPLTITRVTNYTLLYSILAITQVTGNRDGVDAEVIAHCLPFAMGEGRGALLLLGEAPFEMRFLYVGITQRVWGIFFFKKSSVWQKVPKVTVCKRGVGGGQKLSW